MPKAFSKRLPKAFSKRLPKAFSKRLPKALLKRLPKAFSKRLPKALLKRLPKAFSKRLPKAICLERLTKEIVDNLSPIKLYVVPFVGLRAKIIIIYLNSIVIFIRLKVVIFFSFFYFAIVRKSNLA